MGTYLTLLGNTGDIRFYHPTSVYPASHHLRGASATYHMEVVQPPPHLTKNERQGQLTGGKKELEKQKREKHRP